MTTWKWVLVSPSIFRIGKYNLYIYNLLFHKEYAYNIRFLIFSKVKKFLYVGLIFVEGCGWKNGGNGGCSGGCGGVRGGYSGVIVDVVGYLL